MRLPIAFALTLTGLFAGTSSEPTQAQIDDIINKFAAKEAEFAKARSNYTYRQSAKLQELDESGGPMGKWEMVSDIIFTPAGKRVEKVVYSPVQSLEYLILTPEDMQDLRDVQPFVLTTSEIPSYNIRYLGRQKLDEISCYTFAVKPKTMEKGKRYFEGTVWVDDEDLQIVKSYGRGIGYLKKGSDNQFPKFETYREQIDGKYWFPTYTIANDTLQFKDRPQRIRMSVKYENYKMFKSESVIKYGDEAEPSKPPEAKPPETKPPKKP
jgi:hypothetical protein